MRLSILLLSSFVTQVAVGQAPPSEMIPRALAEALLATGGRAPTIFVGALPPTVESKIVLPAGSRVLGGMSNPASATGIILLDGALNTVSEKFQAELVKAQWEVYDPTMMQFYGREFIDAPTAQRRAVTGSTETYCGRGGTLIIRFEPEGFAQTRLHITSLGNNRCADQASQMLQMQANREGPRMPKRPTLINPGAARNQMGICSGNSGFNSGWGGQGTELSSQLTPEEIFAHYAKQLADSGWKQTSPMIGAIWQKPDSTGSLMQYELTVSTNPAVPMCRTVGSELRSRRP